MALPAHVGTRALAYRKNATVNWCPKCATVLANEQVVNGCCWRHEDTPVSQQEREQWFFRTTAYADELLESLDELQGGWPERVLTMQNNWIGRSTGTEVDFTLKDSGERIRVFTTRVDTIFGATCLILAPLHPLVSELGLGKRGQEMAAAAATKRPDDLEKEGFFTGRFAINPYSGEEIPIWVGNFVVMTYGTGAIMAVPAHDQRDFEFCRKHGLPIVPVIRPTDGELASEETMSEAFAEYGVVENSGRFSGLASKDAIERMSAFAEEEGFGQAAITFRLRDWGVSRQRYWGTPIPMIRCARCGVVPVPDEDLPVLLPDGVELTGKGASPLQSVPEFVCVPCPRCGAEAERESDTMDTFVDSSWYFYRYADARNEAAAPFRHGKGGGVVSDRPVHRRSRARCTALDLLPILHKGHARPRTHRLGRASPEAVHTGHGHPKRAQNVQESRKCRQSRRTREDLRLRHSADVRVIRRPPGP